MRRPPARARAASTLALALLTMIGCARREPPSGGPPDLEAPRLVGAEPDSGSAAVAVDAHIKLTFSESMEPRSTGESVSLAPRVAIAQRKWSGRSLTLVLAEPLDSAQTYTVYVSGTARDSHGNPMGTGASVVFTTGANFPRGRIAGEVESRGFTTPSVYLWCYDAGRKNVPDSTARDFDAIGITDEHDEFRIDGLAVPGSYRLWAFADLNGNRSFEPDADVLFPIDTTFALTDGRPVVQNVKLVVVNVRAPGRLKGAVIDSVADSTGVTRVLAVAVKDTTKRALADVDAKGAFSLELERGAWVLRAFRDTNRDAVWQAERERASDPLTVQVDPAGDLVNLRLTIRPRIGGP
jgi:hypothetical protein